MNKNTVKKLAKQQKQAMDQWLKNARKKRSVVPPAVAEAKGKPKRGRKAAV